VWRKWYRLFCGESYAPVTSRKRVMCERVSDEDDTDHIVSVQLDDEESMAQFLDSHNPDDVSCAYSAVLSVCPPPWPEHWRFHTGAVRGRGPQNRGKIQ